MRMNRTYIRNVLQYQSRAFSNDKFIHFQEQPVASFSSWDAENLIVGEQHGVKRVIIRFLFEHKRFFKAIPIIGSFLVQKKNEMLSHAKRKNDIDFSDCIDWYWRDFLDVCYKRLLGRMPDASGIQSYAAMVRAGANNRVIAYSIMKSKEFDARANVRCQKEFRKDYQKFVRHRRLKRIPFLGRFVRLLTTSSQIEQLYDRIERSEAVVMGQMKKAEQYILENQLLLSGTLERIDLERKNREIKFNREIMEQFSLEHDLLSNIFKNQDMYGQISTAISGKVDMDIQMITKVSEKLDELPSFIAAQNAMNHTAVAGFPGGVIGVSVDGFIFGVPSEEWGLAMFLSKYGHFEIASEKFFETLLRPGMTVLDVGANLGIYTLRALRAGCRVFSYEPTPETFYILQQNVKANGFAETGRSHLVQAGIADYSGTATLYRKAGICGQNSFYPEDNAFNNIDVEVITLDSKLDELQKVDLIKMDIEGAEYAALSGMRLLITNNPWVQIVMEFSPHIIRRAGHDPVELLQLLRGYGFSIYQINEDTACPENVSDEQLLKSFSVNLYLKRERSMQ